MRFNGYFQLTFVLSLFCLLASCSSESTTSNNANTATTTTKDETPFWEKENANSRVNGFLKRAQNALKQNKLKPGFLYDTTDVRTFINNHQDYKGKIQIDTVQSKRNGEFRKEYIATVYVSDNLELSASYNTWGIVFKAQTEGNPNEIFIFTKNGWGLFAVSGRNSDLGIWKNDTYFMDIGGQTTQSENAPANLQARGNKYLKAHVRMLRKRAKRKSF
mgnify:CR=1 FL=1